MAASISTRGTSMKAGAFAGVISRPRISAAVAIIAALSLGTLALHVAANAVHPYGYNRDEFYYLACSQHLAFGYVDHPPLMPLITRLWTSAFGDSIDSIRLLPAIAGAGVVALVGLMVRELGGGWKATALATLTAALAPIYLLVGGMLWTPPYEHVIWAACAFFFIRLLKTGDARYWLPIGLMIGIGLETKHNAALLAIAVVAGVLLTSNRRYLANRWLWAGAALALVIALPHIIWQFNHDWPTPEFARNVSSDKNTQGATLDILLMQLVILIPPAAAIWITGLGWCLFARDGRYRMIALLWIVPFVLLALQGGSSAHYLSPAAAPLLAAGAVALERWRPFARTAWVPASSMAVIAVTGIAMMPMTFNALPVDTAESFVRAIGMDEMEMEKGKVGVLPQWFSDRFGWESMTATVATVYQSLPEEDQARAAILAHNYGEADAIDFYGGAYGLPKTISGHNNHYLWGPGDATGEVVIAMGINENFTDGGVAGYERFLRQRFGSVERVASVSCEHCTNEEQGLPIYLLRDPVRPLREMWEDFKHFG
jgi:Dolichyl-phosphate-mannose-protein mannosyltransferase